jgi:hypothetical protein
VCLPFIKSLRLAGIVCRGCVCGDRRHRVSWLRRSWSYRRMASEYGRQLIEYLARFLDSLHGLSYSAAIST